MKRSFIYLVLALSMVLCACGGRSAKPREVYNDLSDSFYVQREPNDSRSAQAISQGAASAGDLVLSLDGSEENYTFKSPTIKGIHDSFSCEDCRYVEKNGQTAFHLCDDDGAHSGLTLELSLPIKAELVSSLKMTYMTSDEIEKVSQVRIVALGQTDSSAIINHSGCPDISGATSNWKTVDFDFSASDLNALADGQGYIRGFQFYFRDKDDTDIYIKDFTLCLSTEGLCRVDAVSKAVFSQGEAVTAVAELIAERLTAENIGANIDVRCKSFTPPTSASHGSLTYRLDLTDTEGNSIFFGSFDAVLKKAEGEWLSLDGEAGITRDSKGQYQSGFDKGGILFLTDNILTAPEGIIGVEYAVVGRDLDPTDPNILWLAPQQLELCAEGIKTLYANACLDLGPTLKEGEDYRFLVRGVTANDNYILHLDIPFKYSPISPEALDALSRALSKLTLTELTCDPASLEATLSELISDDRIALSLEPTAEGVGSARYRLTLSYLSGITNQRAPKVLLDGVERKDLFNFKGDFFTRDITLFYGETPTSEITLLSPYDGQSGIRIASDELVRYWDTDADVVVTPLYDYKKGEPCDPSPVILRWEDVGSGSYTVRLSESPDLSEPWVFTAEAELLEVYGLKAGQRYYWRVEREGALSQVFTFVTEGGYPRYILSDNVSNFRDIGGKTTLEGKTVRQGLAFRFSNLDTASPSDIVLITELLGIKTELDLRGESDLSALKGLIKLHPISIQWYGGIFAEGQSEPIRQAISVFADRDNYPLGYHCAIGRDRTGTVTILILGLLGVDEETILKDYMVSKSSVSGGGDGVDAPTLYTNYLSLINGLDTFGGEDDSFQRKVELYLLSIGITPEQIASIRDILLED